MIVQCPKCRMYFDDEFRNTDCKHETFSANDGKNNFKHYPQSWLSSYNPSSSENHAEYNEWLKQNKIKY